MNALLTEHFGYLSDREKLRCYGDAVASIVRPGDVVVDLGCGSGVLGLACLRAGAGHVHFIDETAIIEVARRTITGAGYGQQASFHRSRAQHVTLPHRVDVIVCDHVGYFGIDYGILEMLDDARHRFLKPGGAIIPSELRLNVAAVESDACRALTANWQGDGIPADYHWVGHLAAETKHAVNLKPEDLLSNSSHFATLLLTEESQAFYSWSAQLVAARSGRLDGIGGWFDCRLAADVWMTNSPLANERLRRSQAFFPLPSPIVRDREIIKVTVMGRPRDEVISWVVELPESGRRFSQSTWNTQVIGQHDLARADPARPAILNARGRARRVVLGYCDGSRTVQDVEQLVLKEHPDLFPSPEEVSAFVTRVLASECGS